MNEQGENKTRHQEEHVTKGVLFSIIRLSHDFIIAHVVYNAERGCQKSTCTGDLAKGKTDRQAEEVCELFSTDLIFLGHRLTVLGIQPDPSKIAAVANWPAPTNKKELFSFLGLAGWNRKFIKNYAEITAPLTDLLSPAVPFLWKEEEDEAFLALKKALSSDPVLKLPDPSRPFVVYTDASKIGVGCVLLQDFGRGLQPVSYESHKLSNHEQNYPTHDRELLSVIHALKKWRHYLVGN